MMTTTAVGLIVGHGNVKAVSENRVAFFPAVAAQARDDEFNSGISARTDRVRVDGVDWLVGESALLFGAARGEQILDRSRYGHGSFVALARHALAQVLPARPSKAVVFVGMPAAWYPDKRARGMLEAAIHKAVEHDVVVRVKVGPEAAGVYYCWLHERNCLDEARAYANVGVIDIGYRDANLALFSQGRYIGGDSLQVGIADALAQIRLLISRTYGIEMNIAEADQAVQKNLLMISGRREALPHGSVEVLRSGLSPILARARSLFPNGGRSLDAIIAGGGGAVVHGVGLVAEFPQLVIPHADLAACSTAELQERIAAARPALAGAYGFAHMAATLLQRDAL